jgi:ubiquinone/menaquinone biosynthesis C-methylase UbiE
VEREASGDQHGSVASELVEHYGVDCFEDTRLSRSPHGRLEFLRTQELIRRLLPIAGARILDIGGGTGVHAAWLAADGHAVHVVDLVPRHVDAAAARVGVTAEVGDARQLSASDESVDVALLLGPLYHLVDPAERLRALAEARRVLRPGGLSVVAAISRYMSLLEVGSEGRLTAEMEASVASVIATGRYDGHAGFVDAHLHTADELHAEMTDAGLQDVAVFGVEGPAWPALDSAGLQEFEGRVEAALRCARIVERDPLMINTSAHLIGVGRK